MTEPRPSPRLAVAIVGRPNVGKSALFNRLVGRRISIVHDEPGVTRDRIVAECRLGRTPFELIDTGGIGGGADETFAVQVRTEAEIAMTSADVIVFVVDGRDGLTPADEILADHLRRSKKPVVIAVNKIDHERHAHSDVEFAGLGFDDRIAVSAEHGIGIADLIDTIESRLPAAPTGEDAGAVSAPAGAEREPLRLAVLGRPNAGKSSLINAILNDERTIVSEVAGTTRDAVDIPYVRDGREFILIDTAGIRSKTKRDSSVEVFSAMRAEKSIRRAHLCALVIDAADGVRIQDRKVARMILEANKPCVIVANKFDLFHPDAKFRDRLEEVEEAVREPLFFLDYAPLIAVSALKREFLSQLFKSIERIRKAAAHPPSTGAVNRMVEHATTAYPPPAMKGGARLNILYATLAKNEGSNPVPVPRFVLFVNRRKLLTNTYARYLENEIRKQTPFPGLPIRFDVRERT